MRTLKKMLVGAASLSLAFGGLVAVSQSAQAITQMPVQSPNTAAKATSVLNAALSGSVLGQDAEAANTDCSAFNYVPQNQNTAEAAKILASVNAHRALAGVQPLEFLTGADYQETWLKLQKAAVSFAAGDKYSHYPDSSFPCFSQDVADAAHGNLSAGWSSNGAINPISGWVGDQGNEDTLGHRLTTIDPYLAKYAYGTAHAASSRITGFKVGMGVGATRYGDAYLPGGAASIMDSSRTFDNTVNWPAPRLLPDVVDGEEEYLREGIARPCLVYQHSEI